MPLPSTVTVIIPVFNGARWVGEAIASVIEQRHPHCAVVVVDDGSTDDTPRELATFGDRIVVVTQQNRGLPAARNSGIRAATSELLIFLDADDLLAMGSIAAFVDAAEAAPSADVFHSGWRGVDFDTRRVLYSTDKPLPLDADPFHVLLETGSPPIGSLCVRRRAIDRAGMFDETLRLQEDFDYWLRLAASGAEFKAVSAPPVTIRCRVNGMSMGAGKALAVTALAVAERAFQAHLPCVLCTDSHRLDSWRRLALRRSAFDISARIPVRGRIGHWIGMAFAMIRTPRWAPAMYRELRARWQTSK